MAVDPQAPLGRDSLGLPVVDDETAIRNLVDRLREEALRRSIEETLGKPNPSRIRDLLKQDRRELPPERQNMLRDPVQVAALPSRITALLGRLGPASPIEVARSFLQGVPVEQARVMEQALMEQQLERDLEMARGNAFGRLSTPEVAPIDYSELDQMVADQIAAERAALEEQDQIAEMEDLASAFGIGMEATPDMGVEGMRSAWGNRADDWAESVYAEEEPVGPVADPISAAPAATFSEPFGEDSLNADAYAMAHGYGADLFADPAQVALMGAMPAISQEADDVARATLQQMEDDQYAAFEGRRGAAFSNLSPALAPSMVSSFAAPAMQGSYSGIGEEDVELGQAVAPDLSLAGSIAAPISNVAAFAAPALQGSYPGIGEEDVELGQAVAPNMALSAIADQVIDDQMLGAVPDIFTDIEETEAEREAYAALEGARGRAFGNLTSPAPAFSNVASFAAPAMQGSFPGIGQEDIELGQAVAPNIGLAALAQQAEDDQMLGNVPGYLAELDAIDSEKDAYSDFEGARGRAFSNLTSPALAPSMVASFASPALADAMAQQQAAALADIGLSPDDMDAQAQAEAMANIGLSPAEMAAAAQFAMPSFVSPAVAEQMAAQARAEAEAYAEMEAARGAAFGNLTSPETVSPALASAMAAVSQEADDVARAELDQQERDAYAGFEGRRGAAFSSLPSVPAMVTLAPDFAAPPSYSPAPLTEQDLADIEAAEAARDQQVSPFGSPLAGTVYGSISPALAMSTTFDMPSKDPFGAFESAHEAAQQEHAPFGSAFNPESNPAVMAREIGTPHFTTLMSVPDLAAEVFGEIDDPAPASANYGGPLGIGAAIGAASLTADPFGVDPFSSATLGFDPLSDPISSSMTSDVAAPAGVDDGGESDDPDGYGDQMSSALGALGLGLGPSDTDVSGIGTDTSTDGSPAGDVGGAAGADVSGGGGDGGLSGFGGDPFGGSSSSSSSSDGGFGPSDMGWASGGRVEMAPQVSKLEAEYHITPGEDQVCRNCQHFVPSQKTCQIVAGRISPEGTSRYFQRRQVEPIDLTGTKKSRGLAATHFWEG